MKKIRLKPVVIFLGQSIMAGLAIAFIAMYFFPDALSTRHNRDFGGQMSPDLVQNQSGSVISYNTAVNAAAPAVISVYASKILKSRSHPLLQDPIFRRFFGHQDSKEQRNTKLGSGVILNNDGYLITNAHVINGADDILITLADGRQSNAKVIGIDTETDLAVLHINLDRLPTISIGDSSALNVGDVVLAIGNPYDLGQTVTQGIVSAIGRKRLGITRFVDFIQTDADINRGNSGGALVTAYGQLVGINTIIFSETGGSQGIGLAVPINLAINVFQQLVDYGHVMRGWLGIGVQVVPRDIVEAAGLQQGSVLVVGVSQAGPADKAGIKPGDIVTEINGDPIFNPQQVLQLISQIRPGTKINILILRGWEEIIVQATVWQRP